VEEVWVPEGETLRKKYTFEGTLDLSGMPAGLQVFLNGRPLGTTPLSPGRIEAGYYDLLVRHPPSGVEKRQQVQVVAGKRTTVSFQ
jgi:hypothetical protein